MNSLKKLLVAATVAVGTQSAFAAWDTGYSIDPTIGNGEMILTIWDSTTKASYSQDLGIRVDDLKSGAAFSGAGISLDGTGLSVFGGDYSNISWNLAAASGQYYASDYSGFQYSTMAVIASGQASSLPTQIDQYSFLSALLPKFNGYQQVIGANIGNYADNEVYTEVNGGPKYAGGSNWSASFVSLLPGSMGVNSANGDTTNLWLMGFADDTGNVALNTILGTATLNLDGSGGTLTFNSAPTVPVPAAAWLFVSGLAGLGGIARSRKRNR